MEERERERERGGEGLIGGWDGISHSLPGYPDFNQDNPAGVGGGIPIPPSLNPKVFGFEVVRVKMFGWFMCCCSTPI